MLKLATQMKCPECGWEGLASDAEPFGYRFLCPRCSPNKVDALPVRPRLMKGQRVSIATDGEHLLPSYSYGQIETLKELGYSDEELDDRLLGIGYWITNVYEVLDENVLVKDDHGEPRLVRDAWCVTLEQAPTAFEYWEREGKDHA